MDSIIIDGNIHLTKAREFIDQGEYALANDEYDKALNSFCIALKNNNSTAYDIVSNLFGEYTKSLEYVDFIIDYYFSSDEYDLLLQKIEKIVNNAKKIEVLKKIIDRCKNDLNNDLASKCYYKLCLIYSNKLERDLIETENRKLKSKYDNIIENRDTGAEVLPYSGTHLYEMKHSYNKINDYKDLEEKKSYKIDTINDFLEKLKNSFLYNDLELLKSKEEVNEFINSILELCKYNKNDYKLMSKLIDFYCYFNCYELIAKIIIENYKTDEEKLKLLEEYVNSTKTINLYFINSLVNEKIKDIIYFKVGINLYKNNNYKDAIDYLMKIDDTNQNIDKIELYTALIFSLININKTEEANKYIDKLINLDSNNIVIQKIKLDLLLNNNENLNISDFNMDEILKSDYIGEKSFIIGNKLLIQNDIKNGIDYLIKAIEKGYNEANKKLSEYYYNNNDKENYIKYYEIYFQNNNRVNISKLVEIYLEQGNYIKALSCLEKSTKNDEILNKIDEICFKNQVYNDYGCLSEETYYLMGCYFFNSNHFDYQKTVGYLGLAINKGNVMAVEKYIDLLELIDAYNIEFNFIESIYNKIDNNYLKSYLKTKLAYFYELGLNGNENKDNARQLINEANKIFKDEVNNHGFGKGQLYSTMISPPFYFDVNDNDFNFKNLLSAYESNYNGDEYYDEIKNYINQGYKVIVRKNIKEVIMNDDINKCDNKTLIFLNSNSTNIFSRSDASISNFYTIDKMKSIIEFTSNYLSDIDGNIQENETKEERDLRIFMQIFYRLANDIEYDYSAIGTDEKTKNSVSRNFDVLLNKKGVCFGYSTVLYNLLSLYDIDSKMLESKRKDTSDFSFPSHAYNQVKIGNQWYFTDLTLASNSIHSDYDTENKELLILKDSLKSKIDFYLQINDCEHQSEFSYLESKTINGENRLIPLIEKIYKEQMIGHTIK